MQKGLEKRLKLIAVFIIAGAFAWFLIISPMIQFHHHESTLEEAARRYFELNPDQLPTGERVKTLSLNTLYKKSYLKEDFHIPYSSKLCSLEKSWVKVRRENQEYRYYVYLDCGFLKSGVDHRGPQIQLTGKEEMTVNIGEKFEDPGVHSVVDDTDGKMDPTTVVVKGEVNTNKAGTYEITYTAFDGFRNKSTVTRVVNVVKVFSGIVKRDLGELPNYSGNPDSNYVRLSHMYFRIYGLTEEEDVILIAEEDVANVGYTKLEKWLDEVYIPHFTEEARKMLVESKFCNMKLNEKDMDMTECNSYTEKRYAYVPSIMDINRASGKTENFMKPSTISWTANAKNRSNAYVTRDIFYGDSYGKDYLLLPSSYNYGVRPKIVVKGDSLVVGGDGTKNNPYTFEETEKAKGGDALNTRYSGEYLMISGTLWRIIQVEKDGTTKIISEDTLGTLSDRPMTYSNPEQSQLTYNPKDKENYGYYINNRSSQYIDTSFFVKKEVDVPIYEKEIIYGEEKSTYSYIVKISPPNMYDMFSAQSVQRGKHSHSYWLINSSMSKERYGGAITDIGVPLNETIAEYDLYGVRAVAFVKKGAVISSGSGTYDSPYKLK
ncbi:MAG: DUF5011 domain-containing protein [Bacilli bacterium]|nr:DUF5011 domain-containing protein [Bacilli bacterium]